VAQRLTGCVRESDTVARMGGDEFVITLYDLNHWEEPGIVARKLLEAFSAPFDLGGLSCSIGISIGVSIYPDDADEARQLIACADFAMYEAKRSGSNNFRYSSKELLQKGLAGRNR
jgi:diguanylate cyclase (GGDEF)-like protein